MKKALTGLLAGALALSLVLPAAADAVYLMDVNPGSWYYSEVSAMAASGLVDGYEDGTFRPDRTVTVAEAVTMTARITGAPTGEADGFWGGQQMDHAYRSGWISETDCARGDYDKPVTRELACKIIASAFGLGYRAGSELPYADAESIGTDYAGSVLSMYANGLLDGYEDNTIRPQDTLTRAQAAAMLHRAMNMDAEPAPEGLITAAGYEAGEIIDYFCDVSLGVEYGDREELIQKWIEPYTYSVSGQATDADMARLEALIAALNGVPGFPGLSPAADGEEAELKISFVDTETMVAVTGSEFNGYARLYSRDNAATKSEIYYNTDLEQSMRDPVLVEELAQSLGLLNDTYDHPESIFYQYPTDADWPCTLDWAVIQLLYSGEIVPGMDEDAVRETAAALVG